VTAKLVFFAWISQTEEELHWFHDTTTVQYRALMSNNTQAKPVVGLFTSIEGHLSIAEAVQDMLKDDFDVRIYFERDDVFDYYVPFYKFFPSFFAIPFHLSRQKNIVQFLNQYFRHRYQGKMRYFFGKHHPKLLINTYFMYNPCLEDLSQKHKVPFINILTDPRTFHPMTIAEHADVNLTFDTHSHTLCLEYFANACVQTMGWFVRPEYEKPYDQKKVRTSLDLQQNVFTILITSGSEGTNIVATILPALLNTTRPIQVLVACGTNKMLYKSIEAISQHVPIDKKKVTIRPIGFTKELYLYMQAADLVVGKAGPNTVFESVATLTPFLAITHIAGQEDGNLDIIRDYQLGFVEENVVKAHKLLRKIIRNPEQLEVFQPHLAKMAAYNAASRNEFRKLVRQLLSQ
jgi:UDP-N-acetylglucosamine:LPS N-acetylglucosamine transferase